MSEVIELYHGTDVQSARKIYAHIDVTAGGKNTDFGQGFYTTDSIESASRWALRRAETRMQRPALVTVYFDKASAISYIKEFEDDLRWARFVMNNRNGYEYIKNIPFKEHNLDARYGITHGRIADIKVIKVAKGLKRRREMLSSLDDILNREFAFQYAFHTEEATRFIVRTTYEEVRL